MSFLIRVLSDPALTELLGDDWHIAPRSLIGMPSLFPWHSHSLRCNVDEVTFTDSRIMIQRSRRLGAVLPCCTSPRRGAPLVVLRIMCSVCNVCDGTYCARHGL